MPTAARSGHGILSSRRCSSRSLAAVVVALVAACSVLLPASPTPIASAAGGTCVADLSTANLNLLFSGQVDEYVGLDALRAYPLPDGRTLWLFQDAYFSPTGARLATLSGARFTHNAALLQTGTCFHAIHGPSTPADQCPNVGSASFVGGALTVNCTRWFWPMGGAMGSDGYLNVFYALVGNITGRGANTGAAPDGVWLARIDPNTLQVASFLPAPDDDGTLLYGWSVESDGAYSYLFANSYDQFNLPDFTSPAPSRTFVARVPAGHFELRPEYWNGAAWTADRAAAQPIGVGDGGAPSSMQPRLIDGVWVSVTKTNDWFGAELAIDSAPAPQGPWVRVRTMALPTKTIDGSTNNYLPHLLPWRSPLGNLVVTVSHNAWNMNPVAYANPTLYRPTFFEVEPPHTMTSPSLGPTTAQLGFVPAAPRRAIDTRPENGLAAGEVRRVSLNGLVSPLADVAAVNIVGVDPLVNGFITAFACDQPRPWASNLIVSAGVTQAAFALVELSASRQICVYSSTDTHLVLDVFGSYVDRTTTSTSSFTTEQRRLLDTRLADDVLQPGRTRRVHVGPGTTAVAINLAATESATAGYVTAYPCDAAFPATSNLNFAAGETLSNFAQIAVSTSGDLCVRSNVTTHVVIDLVGRFSRSADGWWYRATSPTRLADSRDGIGMPVGPITRFVFGAPAVSANSRPALTAVPGTARALVVTAAAVDPRADGWLTVAPCDESTAYGTVALNTSAGRTTANVSVVATPMTSGRDVCMYSMMPSHHLLDLSGWYESA
jgi:hypothetical protein